VSEIKDVYKVLIGNSESGQPWDCKNIDEKFKITKKKSCNFYEEVGWIQRAHD
jgi:hypothetical protein